MSSIVQVVHCIDTEGPLYESLEATFDRINQIWGFKLEPSNENLELLRKKKINLKGFEDEIANLISPNLLNYNDSWEKLNSMLADISTSEYRDQFLDSFGNGLVYSWFCVDHVGYESNPRNRELGFHKIFDRYVELKNSKKSSSDGIHFHYHPMPFSRSAHHCATKYFGSSDTLYQSLARKIIDRSWFPCAFRPGFNAIRPDSHWFLEQFIPFDFSNQAHISDTDLAPDLSSGRFGDWRRAQKNWQPYHPDHNDYQLQGNCKRLIMRCLNIGTRHRLLTQTDVDQAFLEAESKKPVVLSFTHHDFRDMRPDIELVRKMLINAKEKFPKVRFKYSEARNAVREALAINYEPAIRLNLNIRENKLFVDSSVPTFGPQPFLAIKTNNGEYLYDNFDFQVPFKEWTYTFDQQTIFLKNIESIGVGSCDNAGNVCVAIIDYPGTSNEKIRRNNL